jgi:hypothetical protein
MERENPDSLSPNPACFFSPHLSLREEPDDEEDEEHNKEEDDAGDEGDG